MSELDDEEYNATRNLGKMSLEKALDILSHKEDYLIPNSDIYEAVDILVEHIKGKYDL